MCHFVTNFDILTKTMKAITCSQCGALIKRIDTKDKFVACEYCHAKIPIQKEKVFVIHEQIPPKPKLRKLSDKEKNQIFTSVDDNYVPFLDDDTKNWLVIIGFVILAIGLTVFLAYSSSNDGKTSEQPKNFESKTTLTYKFALVE